MYSYGEKNNQETTFNGDQLKTKKKKCIINLLFTCQI